MIQPTIGRKVWFRPNGLTLDASFALIDAGQPCDATIVFVWGDRLVNLQVSDHRGRTHMLMNVSLKQEGDTIACGAYAEWMPYQVGQAKPAPACPCSLQIGGSPPGLRDGQTYVLPLPPGLINSITLNPSAPVAAATSEGSGRPAVYDAIVLAERQAISGHSRKGSSC